MVVLTLKWNKKIALLVVLAVAALLCVLVIAIGSGSRGVDAVSQSVKTNEDRIKFLQDLGWEVDPTPISEKTVVIPKDFSLIYDTYNSLQLEQGYDLSLFRGMDATIFTYNVINYTGYSGTVVADLYVVNNRVVGGDIHSLALDGFMHGLSRK